VAQALGLALAKRNGNKTRTLTGCRSGYGPRGGPNAAGNFGPSVSGGAEAIQTPRGDGAVRELAGLPHATVSGPLRGLSLPPKARATSLGTTPGLDKERRSKAALPWQGKKETESVALHKDAADPEGGPPDPPASDAAAGPHAAEAYQAPG
jgi:hypothetical protein